MVYPYVFELDPKSFHLVREISASRARWQQNINAWVWEQGAAKDICGVDECKVQNFTVTTFPEITETPDDFLKEVKQDKQMNYAELASYIKSLQESGFDTVKLHVQYYKKFAVPVFALIMALISVPFGFLVGNRGAMTGIGVGMAVARHGDLSEKCRVSRSQGAPGSGEFASAISAPGRFLDDRHEQDPTRSRVESGVSRGSPRRQEQRGDHLYAGHQRGSRRYARQDFDGFSDRQVIVGQRGRRYGEDAGAWRHQRAGDSGAADDPRSSRSR